MGEKNDFYGVTMGVTITLWGDHEYTFHLCATWVFAGLCTYDPMLVILCHSMIPLL